MNLTMLKTRLNLKTRLGLYLALTLRKISKFFFSKNQIRHNARSPREGLLCQHMSEKRGVLLLTLIVTHPVVTWQTKDLELHFHIASNSKERRASLLDQRNVNKTGLKLYSMCRVGPYD